MNKIEPLASVLVIAIISLATFVFDIMLPRGVAAGMPYILLVVGGIWLPKRRQVFYLALTGTCLTVLGYFYSSSGSTEWIVVVNRVLAIVIVWITAIIIVYTKTKEFDRRRSEAALDESNQRYRDLATGSLQGILVHCDQNLLYINDALCKMFGYESFDEISTLSSISELIHERDMFGPRNSAKGKWVAETSPYLKECKGVKADGTVFWFESSSRAVQWDGELAEQVTFMDITLRKTEEEILKDSEDRFRSAFENISVGNIVIDDRGIIEIFNSAAEKIFGYSPYEVVGKNVHILMPEPDNKKHEQYIQNFVSTGVRKITGGGREVIGLRKNGEEFPMHIGIGEMYIRGKLSFIGSVTDLTNIKELEGRLLQSQRMEAVGQLTGGIAHDFNNLLAVIQSNVDVLEIRLPKSETIAARAAAIKMAVDRGASLTNRLLAFSRQQELMATSTDVLSLVKSLEDMLRRSLGETIDISIMSASNLWNASIDEHQFENALLNLSINARDSMSDGGKLTIHTSNVTIDAINADMDEDLKSGDYVLVSVTDTGDGIPPTVLNKVFEPFFTTKEVGLGTGLGLSMVYGFAKQSRGHVTIKSEVGRGTTVHLYLPRATSVEANIVADFESMNAEGGSERILVVEDDPHLRSIAVEMLSEHGFQIDAACDGNEAFKYLNSDHKFDLLFTDVILPGSVNGIEIADEARRLQPDINVLYTSGYAESVIALEDQINSGMLMIGKPYQIEDLLRAIRGIFDTKAI